MITTSNVIKMAGENAGELNKVLMHYKDSTLKYEAASFLITNMLNKFTITHEVRSSNNQLVDMSDILLLDSIQLIDTLQKLKFISSKKIMDINQVNTDFLINEIDNAFYVWQTYPWCKELSFETFCEKILPYRIANEPLSDWKTYYLNKHKHIIDSLALEYTSLDNLVFTLNKIVGKQYISKLNTTPTSCSYELIEKVGGGIVLPNQATKISAN